jgi:15,16-dihydrobiliverdin:ferredoxin oxidoreductase
MIFLALTLLSNIGLTLSVALSPKISRAKTFSSSVTELPITNPLAWTESIQPTRNLPYMPILEFQLRVMQSMKFEKIAIDDRFTYKSSSVKPARISCEAYRNSIFRNVRLTYFDAGDSVQVFNSLWCPDFSYDIPMLGIDLISLGKNRVLIVIDFQPLLPTTDYSDKYISPLTAIREKYPDLQGTLSGKFYDDTSFFSQNMLFGRFTDESKLMSTVYPAFQEYLVHYVKLASSTAPNDSPESIKMVRDRQEAYDIFSAAKDPAVGLFNAYFGKEWSSDFVHQFLFPLSAHSDASYTPPVHNFKIA